MDNMYHCAIFSIIHKLQDDLRFELLFGQFKGFSILPFCASSISFIPKINAILKVSSSENDLVTRNDT